MSTGSTSRHVQMAGDLVFAVEFIAETLWEVMWLEVHSCSDYGR